jgi:tight adherence protein C
MLLLLACVLIAVAAYVAGEVVTEPSRARSGLIRRAATYGRVRVSREEELLRFQERVVEPGIRRLAAMTLRLNPKTTVDVIAQRLLVAGLSRSISPTGFLAAKGGLGIAGFVAGLVIGGLFAGLAGAFVFALPWAAAGFALPGLFLGSRTRRRREQIRAELPDALDLLAVSVEAGLGFDGAVAKLTEHMEGPLADELSLTLGEMRIGMGRQEALKKLAERAAAPEVGNFCRAIVQADQLGISLGRILKVQAADTRLRRQSAAEERAMKAPIKMLFPTVAFIFPAMFLVILGPAILNIKTLF